MARKETKERFWGEMGLRLKLLDKPPSRKNVRHGLIHLSHRVLQRGQGHGERSALDNGLLQNHLGPEQGRGVLVLRGGPRGGLGCSRGG